MFDIYEYYDGGNILTITVDGDNTLIVHVYDGERAAIIIPPREVEKLVEALKGCINS